MTWPCHKCDNRFYGCHADCELYNQFTSKMLAYNQTIKSQDYADIIRHTNIRDKEVKYRQRYKRGGGNK